MPRGSKRRRGSGARSNEAEQPAEDIHDDGCVSAMCPQRKLSLSPTMLASSPGQRARVRAPYPAAGRTRLPRRHSRPLPQSRAISNNEHISSVCTVSVWCDRVETWDAGFFKVKRVLDHRAARGGKIEYEIEWLQLKKNGEPWPLEWVPADALTPDLIEAYNVKRMHGVPNVHVNVNGDVRAAAGRAVGAHAPAECARVVRIARASRRSGSMPCACCTRARLLDLSVAAACREARFDTV